MIKEQREQRLARRAIEGGVLEARAKHWANRYPGRVTADELESAGNFALDRIVREFPGELSAFDDYCRRSLDWAMLSSIRVEARRQRIEKAAQLASSDLLATHRAGPGASPEEQIRAVSRAVAAATFVAMAQEAQRGGDEDMIARAEYATAMSIIQETLAELPKPQRRFFVLHYEDGQTIEAISGILGLHRSTLERWRDRVLARIRVRLEKREVDHAPTRGGAPRLRVLKGLREPEDERRVEDGEDDEPGEGSTR